MMRGSSTQVSERRCDRIIVMRHKPTQDTWLDQKGTDALAVVMVMRG
jgi:hypothetical protein